MRKLLALTSIVFFLENCIHVSGQLKAEYVSSKLPRGLYGAVPLFDGDDNIYLFGGIHGLGIYSNLVLKYSITEDILEEVGILPDVAPIGSIQADRNGNIFYFGGHINGTGIFQYNPISTASSIIGQLPFAVHRCSTTKYDVSSGVLYIMGGSGHQNNITMFDMDALTITTEVGTLPQSYSTITSVKIEFKEYIIGDAWDGGEEPVVVLDLETFESEIGLASLPDIQANPRAVYDGHFIWIIGGYEYGAPMEGLLRLNPVDFEWEFVSVDGFPIGGNAYWYTAPTTVYVRPLNRIYFFGGESWEGVYYPKDDIWYVDLAP